MSKKIEINIPNRKKPSTMTIHETSLPMISIKLYSQAYELMKKSFKLGLGGCPFKEYYNELNFIFWNLII